MNVALVIDSVSRASGGLLGAERSLHQHLDELGVNTIVFALADEHTTADLPSWAPLIPKVFPHQGLAALGCSSDMRQAILAAPADLIYRAGLWRMPSRYAHEWSRKRNRPEIIAPHGMLDPWAVRNSRWKKRLAHHWFEGAHLRDASCLRALCESEAQAIRAYGLRNPVCVIPNGVDLPAEDVVRCPLSVVRDCGCVPDHGAQAQQTTDNRQPTTDHSFISSDDGPRILLFLGRLHPKKGLVNALKAWKQALHSTSNIQNSKFHEWQFVVCGWDQGGHEADLKRLCDELGVAYSETPAALFTDNRQQTTDNSSSVIFTGPAFGEQKDQLLRRANAFILPSFSEGLPMSVLEAWAYRLPVLMTDHCNLPEGFLSDAALRIGTDVASIAEGMLLLLQSPIHDLRSLGANGRALVERQFAWPQIASQMKDVYEWVLGGGPRPSSVGR